MPTTLRAPVPSLLVASTIVLAAAVCPAKAQGQEDDSVRPVDARAGVSGSWFGIRDRLARRGVEVTVILQGDPSANLRGGLRRGATIRVPVQASIDVDTERLFGWGGGHLHAGVQALEGQNASETLVGDLQGFSNVDAQRFRQVSELWLEQTLLGDRLRLKVGKADANADFALVEAGGEFLNSSAGYTPTIQGFPSYPDPAMGVGLFLSAPRGLSLGAGLYDGATHEGCHGRTGNRGLSTFFGAPDAYFMVGEAGLHYSLGGLPGRFSLGTWRHTGTFEGFDGVTQRGTGGHYAVLEQRVRQEPHAPGQGLDLFVQLGSSDPRFAEIERHVSLGLVSTGWLPGRDRDVIGLMVTSAAKSTLCAAPGAERRESVLELFYGLSLRPWLVVKPDLQYIVNPGAVEAEDAFVATVRVSVVF